MSVDIRELISADEVASELEMGPNGALVYCMEFLLENVEWLEEKLDQFIDNDYIIFDLPGQIELYTHFPFMRDLIQYLHKWDFRVQALYFPDSQFMGDTPKFFGGCLTALSCMLQLTVPHINVMSKMDLARGVEESRVDQFLFPETELLLKELSYHTSERQLRLNSAMGHLIDSFNMIAFTPLNIADNESIAYLLLQADQALQFEDEVEVKAREVEPDELPDQTL